MGTLLCKTNKNPNKEYIYNRIATFKEKEIQLNKREKLYQQVDELFDNIKQNNVYKNQEEQIKELQLFHNKKEIKDSDEKQNQSQIFLYHISKKSLQEKDSNYGLRNLKEIQFLAEGSFGQVILVQNSNRQNFVVKKIPLQNLAKEDEQHLLDEINILNELKHPNIIKYLSHKYDQQNLLIYLEYMELGSIGEILENVGPIPEALVAYFINQILEGLQFIHLKNIIHRDLKGDNILVGIDGHIKIGDFGSACYQSQQQKSTGGTIAWMAPELLQYQNWDNKVDIWSLGCLVYEMLTGQSPFYCKKQEQITSKINHFNDEYQFLENQNFQIITIDFIKCCIQKNPKKRMTIKKLQEHPFCNLAIPMDKALGDLTNTQLQELELKKTQNLSFDSLRSF